MPAPKTKPEILYSGVSKIVEDDSLKYTFMIMIYD